MELNLTHEIIRVNETIFDGTLEQAVELDYSLPDYYPGIFKVLKCILHPSIYNCRVSGNQLVADGVSVIKLLYLGEGSNQVHSLEQKIPFSKTVEMKGEADRPVIHYTVKADYINCRVVNPSRIDLRGSVSIRIRVCDQKEEMVVSGAEGAGVQLNQWSQRVGSEHLWGTKQFSASEEVEAKPAVGELLAYHACACAGETKIISNKLVVKGEVMLHLLYRPESEEMGLQTMDCTIPVSQILDLQGVDEDYRCCVSIDVTNLELSLESGESGTVIRIEMDLTVCGDAFLEKDISCVSDAFSTQYQSELTSRELKTEQLVKLLSDSLVAKQTVGLNGAREVQDVWCDVGNIAVQPGTDTLDFTGELRAVIVYEDEEGVPGVQEKTIPIDFKLAGSVPGNSLNCDTRLCVAGLEFSFSSGELELRAELRISGRISCEKRLTAVTGITLDETRPKEKNNDAALTIYYADEGEQVWEIAKRYNTSVNAIVEENGLDQMTIPQRSMILIPIVE